MAIPLPPRGGQAPQVNKNVPYVPPKIPKTPGTKQPKPGSPGTPGWTAFTQARWAENHQPQIETAQANTSALNAFHTALQQLKASTPAVNTVPILAPYQAAETAASQLGTGLQQAEANAGQTAQNQYTQGLGDAQARAASFGISAGAGANPTALSNNGSAGIANISQAQQAAAPQAAAAWQALLQRTGATAVSNAQLARQQGLTTAGQTLAASLPTLIGNAKQQALQDRTETDNLNLAKSQLSEKQIESMNADELKKFGITSANTRSANSIAAAGQRSQNTINAENTRQNKALAQAKSKGIQGLSQALGVLKVPGSTSGGTRQAKGFDALIQPWGVDSNGKPVALGPAVSKHLPSLAPIQGYKILSSTTHYETVPTANNASGTFSWSRYKQALAILQRANPDIPAAQLMPLLGATPNTK